jgi:hypothetical protein
MPPAVDAYSFQARVIPVATVCLPPLILLGTGVVTGARLGIAAGLVMAVLAAIAGQLGRDRGRALQPDLWSGWGGSPTLQRLRYRDQGDHGRVARLHSRIEAVLGDTLPTADEELADPPAADARYEEVSARIRALTQDHSRFGRLFAENVSYGQRRNLLGLRPIGMAVAFVTLVGCCVLLLATHGSSADRLGRYGPGLGVSLGVLALWVLVVTPQWVRVPADAYAEQFVGVVDQLHHERGAS